MWNSSNDAISSPRERVDVFPGGFEGVENVVAEIRHP